MSGTAAALGVASCGLTLLSVVLPAAYFLGQFGILVGLIAVGLGIVGVQQARRRGGDGKRLSLAGLVAGIVGATIPLAVAVAAAIDFAHHS